jgi:hypothetical protein
MNRRWLGWVPVAIVLFAVSMNMAHIGSEWLWTAVIVVAAASTWSSGESRMMRGGGDVSSRAPKRCAVSSDAFTVVCP